MFRKKRWVVWLLIIAVLSGCSNASYDSANYAAETASSGSAHYSVADQSSTADLGMAVGHVNQGEGGAGTASNNEFEQVSTSNRQIIYTANVSMQIKDYDHSRLEIRDLVHMSGGYILNFQESSNEKEKSGSLTVKIPAERFDSFLDQLEQLQPISFRQNVQGEDVTAEYIDYSARLTAQQLVEERLLTFMEQATRSSDLLEFSNELGRVQQTIEQIKGHLRYLEEHIAYSTITIHLTERLDGRVSSFSPMFTERINDSFKDSILGVSRFLQGFVVFIVWIIPVMIVIALFAIPVWFIVRRIWRRVKGQAYYVQQDVEQQEIVFEDEKDDEEGR